MNADKFHLHWGLAMNSENDFNLLIRYRKFLMGFASLWILVNHEWNPIFTVWPFHRIEDLIKTIGFCGVDIFFFLSAVGLYYSIQKNSLFQFYYHRIRRLIVPFLLTAILYSVTRGDWTVELFLRNISGINFFTVNIYSYLWFVPAIVIFYLFFPLYYAFFDRSRNKFIFTLCVLALWLLGTLALRNTMREDLFGFTNRIPVFCTGCLAGYLSRNKKHKFEVGGWILLVLMLVLGLYFSFLTNYRDFPLIVPVPNCCVPNFLMTVSLCFLLPKFVEWSETILGVRHLVKWGVRSLEFFGIFSYELYCVQERIGNFCYPSVSSHFGSFGTNICLFLIIFPTGVCLYLIQKGFWLLFDKMVLFLKNSGAAQIR